ncbi:uncharacterized protein LOC144652958 [Oculina patagonica]
MVTPGWKQSLPKADHAWISYKKTPALAYLNWTQPGELIGVEYLYGQTGKVLQDSEDQQEEEQTPEEADEDDDDEGFHDATAELDDPTVAYTGDEPVPEIISNLA